MTEILRYKVCRFNRPFCKLDTYTFLLMVHQKYPLEHYLIIFEIKIANLLNNMLSEKGRLSLQKAADFPKRNLQLVI